MIDSDLKWIDGMEWYTTINRLPKRNRNEPGFGRESQRLDCDNLGLRRFIGRLLTSFMKPKLNRQTRYKAIQMRFNNQPAERWAKEHINRQCEERNNYKNRDFKFLGDRPGETESEKDLLNMFGSSIMTFPSTVAASWCLVSLPCPPLESFWLASTITAVLGKGPQSANLRML